LTSDKRPVINLLVLRSVAPERIWKLGAPVRSKSGGTLRRRKIFLALKAQLVVLVSAFVMVSTVWSVSYLLFFYSRCPVPSHL